MIRPPFIPPADWPTNDEIVSRTLCHWASSVGAACQCDPARPCVQAEEMFGGLAVGICGALAEASRLVSPTITRQPPEEPKA